MSFVQLDVSFLDQYFFQQKRNIQYFGEKIVYLSPRIDNKFKFIHGSHFNMENTSIDILFAKMSYDL